MVSRSKNQQNGVCMKKVIAFLFCTLLYSVCSAVDLTSVVAVNISTFDVTGNNYKRNLGTTLTLSSATAQVDIYKITINNSDPTIKQTVTFYQWGNIGVSSTLVKAIWCDTVGSTLTVTPNPYVENFGDYPLPCINGLAIRKSSLLSDITVCIEYAIKRSLW
jgi:hypothetical protein